MVLHGLSLVCMDSCFLFAVDLSDVYLSDLSAHIGREWQTLASYLNISRARVDQIKADHPYTRDQITTMLVDWRNRAPGPDSVDKQLLLEAIKKSRATLPQVRIV